MQSVSFQAPLSGSSPSALEPARIVVSEVDRPSPSENEVLIEVQAAGVNMADILQRQGRYPVPAGASQVPGLEVSGTIAGVGSAVDRWKTGDEVCALLAGGGYSEYVTVDSRNVLPRPRGMTFEQAAGIIEVAATCWANLLMHAKVRPSDWVLIHGGAGGIGTFAIQLLRALGVNVIATAGTDAKVKHCLDLGANAAINYRSEKFPDAVYSITGGHGANVILDVVGGDYVQANVQSLARGGRLVIIGSQGGREGSLPIGELMAKRAWVTGTTLRARDVDEKSEILDELRINVWPLFDENKISAEFTQSIQLTKAEEAHRIFVSPDRIGKIVLTMIY